MASVVVTHMDSMGLSDYSGSAFSYLSPDSSRDEITSGLGLLREKVDYSGARLIYLGVLYSTFQMGSF